MNNVKTKRVPMTLTQKKKIATKVFRTFLIFTVFVIAFANLGKVVKVEPLFKMVAITPTTTSSPTSTPTAKVVLGTTSTATEAVEHTSLEVTISAEAVATETLAATEVAEGTHPDTSRWKIVILDREMSSRILVDGTCYQFPAGWTVRTESGEKVTCTEVEVDLTSETDMPEIFAVSPFLSLPKGYHQESADGLLEEVDSEGGLIRICSTTEVVKQNFEDVTIYHVFTDIVDSHGFPGRFTGNCYTVKYSQAHQTTISLVREIYNNLNTNTYYRVQIDDLNGNWMGEKAYQNLPPK